MLRTATLLLALLVLPPLVAPASAENEGELDTAGFHSPDGFFLSAASTNAEIFFSVSRAAVSGDWAIVAYSSPDHDLAWRIVSPEGATAPCTVVVPGVDFFPSDARLDRDGRLLVSGVLSTAGSGRTLFVARLLFAGCALDDSFSEDGIFLYDLPWNLAGGRLALQYLGIPPFTSEKIVLAGTVVYAEEPDWSDIVVLRLDEDGGYDEDFGFGGAQLLDHGDDDTGLADLLIDRENRLVLAGSAGSGIPGLDALLVRLQIDGSPDPSFGTSGYRRFHQASTDRADLVEAVVRAPNGDLYLAGTSNDANDGLLVVTRLSGANGASLGYALWPAGIGRYLRGAALQGDVRIVVAGQTLSTADSNLFTAALRIPELTFDPAYNDPSDFQPLTFVDLGVTGRPHEMGHGLVMANERPILTGHLVDTVNGSNVQPYVLRLENSFLFGDGFESGNRGAWD